MLVSAVFARHPAKTNAKRSALQLRVDALRSRQRPRRKMRQVHIPQTGSFRDLPAEFTEGRPHPIARAIPIDRQASNEIMREGQGGHSVIRGLSGGGDGAGDEDVLAEVPSVIDPRENKVRLHAQPKKRDSHAIRRSAMDLVPILSHPLRLERRVSGDAVAALGVLLSRSHNRASRAGPAPDRALESRQTCRVNAVVVGQ